MQPAFSVLAPSEELRVTPRDQRTTGLYLTKFEIAKVVGERAKQIAAGAVTLIRRPDPRGRGGTVTRTSSVYATAEACADPRALAVDPVMMAKRELVERCIPMLVQRTLPDGRVENIPVNELAIDLTWLDLDF